MKKPVYLFSLIAALVLGVGTGYLLRPAPANPKPQPVEMQHKEEMPASPVSIPGLTAENYPSVNGSVTTTLLAELIASRACGLQGELRRQADRECTAIVDFPLHADKQHLSQYMQLHRRAHTWHHGTNGAYENLIKTIHDSTLNAGVFREYDTQLILVARKPSPEELTAAKGVGVTLDVRPIARDAFVFMVNKENRVPTLTLDEISDIYTRKITDWQELGSKAGRIFSFSDLHSSGDIHDMMAQLVLHERQQRGERDEMRNLADRMKRFSEQPRAFGYSFYYYEHMLNPHDDLRMLGVEGIPPTPENIANGSYPLCTNVYVVTRKGLQPDHPASILRDWLLSPDGQQVVAASGYVPIK